MGHIRISKHYIHIPYLLLGVLESLIFFASVYVGAIFRVGRTDVVANDALFPQAILFSVVMLLGMISMGVYQSHKSEGYAGILLRTATAFLLGGMALSVFFILFPDQLTGRGVIALAAFTSFLLVWITRVVFVWAVDEDTLSPKVMFLGAGNRAKNILDKVDRSADQLGFTVVGCLPMGDETIKVPENMVLRKPEGINLTQFAESLDLEEVVVVVEDRRAFFPMSDLLDCKLSGIAVLDVMSFFEREAKKVDIEMLNPSWFIFSDGFNNSALRSFFERGFDLAMSSLILLATFPIMLLTVLAIKLEDGFGSSVFYSQSRVGLDGEPFNVHKFRSMRENAEKDGVAVWASANDDRITKVGNFIRKVRIDELPQLYNIWKGNMALIGPRPERPQFVDELVEKIPFYKERHRVKPGLTGWAQLLYPYGDSIDDAKGKLEYDLYYVKNHSLLLDCLVLLKTIEIVLFGKGR